MAYQKLNDKFHQRRLFDPASEQDLQELFYFLNHGTWKTACPFYAEFPWVNIPVMCQQKYTLHSLSKTMKLEPKVSVAA
jgi:hypothetical protein